MTMNISHRCQHFHIPLIAMSMLAAQSRAIQPVPKPQGPDLTPSQLAAMRQAAPPNQQAFGAPIATASILDAKAALLAAEHILGIALPANAAASILTTPDDTLFSDKPISVADPAWLITVPGAVFTLDWPDDDEPLPDGKKTIDTNPLDYEVLLRGSSSAVLRIASKPIRITKPAGTVRSLSAADYRAAIGDYTTIRGIEVQPRSTLRAIYNSLLRSSGYPLGAEQVVVHVWSWSEKGSQYIELRDVWCVEVRSDPSKESQTLGFEARIPEESRPKVSSMTCVVADASNAPYFASNHPYPMIVDDAGVIVDPGENAAALQAREVLYRKEAEAEKAKGK